MTSFSLPGSASGHSRGDFLVDFEPVERPRTDGALALREHSLPRVAPALSASQALVKRVIDVVGATIGLIVSAPLLAVLAILIRLDSPGAPVFAQVRLGLLGESFVMFKLRTMRYGAELDRESLGHLNVSDDWRLFKIHEDPRVTRLGRIMRRWSLDELPQLYNVLIGEMSLVGPRPNCEEDFPRYEPHHYRRLAVKPGLTGHWQVSGRSSIVKFEEVVRLDCEYIDRWSVGLDLSIMLRTLPAVIKRRGAY